MHHFFYIPELVLQVFRCVDTTRDLYHLGSTCKRLWTVAESELWGDKVDSRMLACLIPGRVTLSDPVTEQMNAPLRRRLSCTTEIRLHHTCMPQHGVWGVPHGRCRRLNDILFFMTQPDVVAAISARALRVLVCPHIAEPLCQLFFRLPSTIDNLDLELLRVETWGYGLAGALLGALKHRAPPLSRLSVESSSEIGNGDSDVTLGELEEIFSKVVQEPPLFGSLVRVKLYELRNGYTAMPILGRMPCLEVLSVRISSGSALLPYSLPPGSFPSLRELTMDSDVSAFFPHHLRILQSISSDSLRKLYFHTHDQAQAVAVMQFLSTRWPTTFEDIELHTEEEGDLSLLKLLEPLSTVVQLRRLAVYYEQYYLVSDDDLIKFTERWPNLVAFHVIPLLPGPAPELSMPPPGASLRGLRGIAKGMPLLEDLSLAINFDIEEDDAEATEPANRLVMLDLRMSQVSDLQRAVPIISALFPRLRCFNHFPQNLERVATALGLPRGG